MNDKRNDLVDGLDAETPVVGAEAATLVPVVAEADGILVSSDAVADGEHVCEGEVVAYVQTDEDA